MIKETFLHFIWKLQYFHKQNLTTTQGEPVHILFQGNYNTDAGPDFLNARIKIGALEWYGNVEIHMQSSDWNMHHHQGDGAYNNVILHVVWSEDEPIRRDDDSRIPTLELKQRISEALILKYSSMLHAKEEIPCAGHWNSISSLKKISTIDRMVAERLESRRTFVKQLVHRNQGDWQETSYQMVCRNFGFKLNSEPLLRLAYAIPFKTLMWHRKNLMQLEALLFGQAGLLHEHFEEEYPCQLQKEYEFLSKKLSYPSPALSKAEWKFLRVRPANFPTIRIAELASLIHFCPELFTSITDFKSVKEIKKLLGNAQLSEYWKEHYAFKKASKVRLNKRLGEDSVENLVINTVVPYLFALGKEKDQAQLVEKALTFLEEISGEENKIIRSWEALGAVVSNAYDSQGLLELYTNYCSKKNCLECELGVSILNSKHLINES